MDLHSFLVGRKPPELAHLKYKELNVSKPQQFAAVVMAAIFLVVILYDLLIVLLDMEGGTISEWLWFYSRQHPEIPFFFGMVAGHLFWK